MQSLGVRAVKSRIPSPLILMWFVDAILAGALLACESEVVLSRKMMHGYLCENIAMWFGISLMVRSFIFVAVSNDLHFHFFKKEQESQEQESQEPAPQTEE